MSAVDRQAVVAEGSAALAELARTYRDAVAVVTELVRLQTGVDLTPAAQPPIMDARREQLEEAVGRARQALRAMDLVLSVHWGDCTTLGEVIRDEYWSEDDRRLIVDHLIAAGLS